MSFKVGDKVVFKNKSDSFNRNGLGMNEVLEISDINFMDYLIFNISKHGFGKDRFRHATPEEVAAGYRIDHCVEVTKKVELFGNSEGLEVLEMINVSPNCEVSEL